MSAAPLRGAAGEIHARDLAPPTGPGATLAWIEATGPALVLGSRQAAVPGLVDEVACARDGVEIARRRSGGGAVWLAPGEHLWVDVLVGRDDPRWDDDVTRACGWLGDAWCEALAAEGLASPGDLAVHRGGLVHDAPVCFAAMGPGEVALGGAKLVGLSQRRTREGARFQCVVHARWVPDAYRAYGPGLGEPPAPSDVAALPALAGGAAARALVARLGEVVAAR